eukprot:NODE_2081_length_1302_cov_85.833200_g1893_i0.p1 GENE.NODE_2081_length_1302_cov_85.833200_g1893_i0~~NODE_2081_length_1302_cov_85.833200_g1893_i0.p1  ORF type:complete len:310 (-),score=57.04 NODE_2081_length_1302_cov_85.833200_g1893_i0:302-1231(-)
MYQPPYPSFDGPSLSPYPSTAPYGGAGMRTYEYTPSYMPPQPHHYDMPVPMEREATFSDCSPERDDVPREEGQSHRQAMVDDSESAFSLALSEVTTVKPGHTNLTLPEELMLLKAGDKPKFPRRNPKLDVHCAGALLLDLIGQRRVGPDCNYDVEPRKLILKIIDETPTGSKLEDSALSNLNKKAKVPPTTEWFIKKASPNLCSAILWRLVKKGKLSYDPRAFGTDRYPVRAVEELNSVRQRVVAVVEGRGDPSNWHDNFLTFLYYLPEDSSSKVFGERDDAASEDSRVLTRSVMFAVNALARDTKGFL